MPTPRFIRSAAPTFTERYSGLEAGLRDYERRGFTNGRAAWGLNLDPHTVASRDYLTVQAPAASVNIGTPLASGGSVVTFTRPKSFQSLYTGGASMGTGAEYLRARNAQSQNYLSAISR